MKKTEKPFSYPERTVAACPRYRAADPCGEGCGADSTRGRWSLDSLWWKAVDAFISSLVHYSSNEPMKVMAR